MTRRDLTFIVGGVAVVFNSMSVALFAAWQPTDQTATLTVAIVGAINAGLATTAAYLRESTPAP
jgi:hypothetical protein